VDDLSKEYVRSFFERNLMLHGDRPEAVRWTAPGQLRHYERMLGIGALGGRRVLDFGCGKGDFYQFLMDRGLSVRYSGWDISEGLIGLAVRKYPGVDFRLLDIDRDRIDQDFDYIFLCGVFNLKVQGADGMIRRTLKKLFSHCRFGLAYDGLSDNSPKKDFELYYASPEGMHDFAVRELSPYVVLRQDRITYDFAMFVYRDAQVLRDEDALIVRKGEGLHEPV